MVYFARGRHSECEQITYVDIRGYMQAVVSHEGEHGIEEGEAVRLNRRHIGQGPSATAQGEGSEWGTWAYLTSEHEARSAVAAHRLAP